MTQKNRSTKGKRILFTPPRSRNDIYLNPEPVPEDQLAYYARAFHQAGRKLVDSPRSQGTLRDLEACPIIYLYRHALELYLKSMLINGNKLLRARGIQAVPHERSLDQHRLTDLLCATRDIFEAGGINWQLDSPALSSYQDVADRVNEIDSVDQKSMVFRYPMDKRGAPSLPGRLAFNLYGFAASMDILLNSLDDRAIGLVDQADAEIQANIDAAHHVGYPEGDA